MTTEPLSRPSISGLVWNWLNRKVGLPTLEERYEFNFSRDYKDADRQGLWDREEDREGLHAAWMLRHTDPERAFVAILKSAKEGSVVAMNDVGETYYWRRLGVEKDEKEAEAWFAKASLARSRRAMLNYIQLIWARGDYEAAEKLCAPFVEENWPPALYWTAAARNKQLGETAARAEVLPLLERAAAQGHFNSRWRLGRWMARGRFGLRRIPEGHMIAWRYSHDFLEAWTARDKNLDK